MKASISIRCCCSQTRYSQPYPAETGPCGSLAHAHSPSPLLSGNLQRLTTPRMLVTAAAKLEERRLDLTASLRSAALQIDTSGLLDLAQSDYEGFNINALLLKPEALFPNMRGRDVRLRATVAGPFAAPTVDYAATSPFIAFDATRSEEHTSELQSLKSISYAVFCLKKNKISLHQLTT